MLFLLHEPQTVTPNSNGKLMKLHIIILLCILLINLTRQVYENPASDI